MRLYVKVSTMMFSDPKILAVSVPARWLYVCGLMWSKEHLTDGEVSREAVAMFGVPQAKRCTSELVHASLWIETPTGYTVGAAKWAAYQTTRAEVQEDRERTRERVNHHRAKRRSEPPGNAVTPALHDPTCNAVTPPPCNANVTAPEYREQSTENKDNGARAPLPTEKTAEKPPNNTAAIAGVLSRSGFSPTWAHRTAGMFRTLDPDRVAEIVELVAERYPGRPADRQALTYTALTAEGTADAWHKPPPDAPADVTTSPAFLAAMARAGGTNS